MKKKMIVKVIYDFEGKTHERLFLKEGNDSAQLRNRFNDVVDMYKHLIKVYKFSNVNISSELVLETRPTIYIFNSK